MATKRHLKNAPIHEALIDIQWSSHVPIEALEKWKDAFASQFADCKNIWQASVGFDLEKEGRIEPQKSQVGYRLETPGVPHVLQCRNNGFTFSRLAPYQSWEHIRDEAKAAWGQIISVAQPESINRLAVRYINALKLPLPFESFATYLAVSPEVPAGLPQTLAGFLQRYVISRQDGCTAIVTQVLEESNIQITPEGITVFLDIDVFKPVDLKPDNPDIWTTLETLRDFKNDVFFEYLTESSIRLYE